MPELSYPQTTTTNARSRGIGLIIFLAVIAIGAVYCAVHLVSDLQSVQSLSFLPSLLLGVALLIALGFEFVNGFHDTANAVATVIYTHSLTPNIAVMWSGTWNFLGVLTSSGAVAFGVLQLLPVELILQVGNSAGFAMVFALLIAAIIWNLGTWYFGLPLSGSPTLAGSLLGGGRDDRGGPDQPVDARLQRPQRRGLEPGAGRRQVARVLADRRLPAVRI